jgi:ATP-dependent DNA ligase
MFADVWVAVRVQLRRLVLRLLRAMLVAADSLRSGCCLVGSQVGADTAEMAERAPPRSRPAAGGLIQPMLATAGPVPVGPGWGYEVKFDGVRAIGYATEGGVRLYSRNDRDVSRSYPEIAALEIDHGVVVDGELVALDQHGDRISVCCSIACTSRHRTRS